MCTRATTKARQTDRTVREFRSDRSVTIRIPIWNIIRRDKLLDTLHTFLGRSEFRICLLLAATSLEPRLLTSNCHSFATTIGRQQGDHFSPALGLFTVYIERALCDLRYFLQARLPADATSTQTTRISAFLRVRSLTRKVPYTFRSRNELPVARANTNR